MTDESRVRRIGWSSRPSRLTDHPPHATLAADRLQRLLHVMARAYGTDGAPLSALADELGVPTDAIVADLRELQERDAYHPVGGADDFRIDIEPDRVRVWTAYDLDRPPKLTAREAVALWVGLEVTRSLDGRAEESDLRSRLRRHLVQQPEESLETPVAIASEPPGSAIVRESLASAAAACRCCTFSYLKDGHGPEWRRLRPYAVVHAEGRWYALGHCESAERVRTFRLDRILEARVEEASFEPPPDFDPGEHLDIPGGRAFEAGSHAEARVRYSARIARWIAEREYGEWLEDGCFVVRHAVADPAWLARHVLQYAGEAEVLEPSELRELVRKQAAAVALAAAAGSPSLGGGGSSR